MKYFKIGLMAAFLFVSTTSLYAWREAGGERFGGGGGGSAHHNNRYMSENRFQGDHYHQGNFNEGQRYGDYHHYGDRNAYEAGWNQGSNYGGGGGAVYQPNSSFEQLEQYANPNSGINQNFQYNQKQMQQHQGQY